MRQFVFLTALAALAACDQQSNEPVTNEAASDGVSSVDAKPEGGGVPDGEDTSRPVNDITNDAMRWNFSRTARGPKLTYGEPATDNVKLTLRCDGSERIELSFMRPSSAAADGDSMVVAAGGAERQLQSTAEQTELGPVLVRGVTPASSGPIQNFRSGSGLQVRWRGETISVPAAGEQARQLLDSCRA